MSRTPSSETEAQETTSLGFVRLPADACEEAAHRLNVVIRMLNDHDCHVGSPRPDDDPADDDGGYDLSIARGALRDIRDMLGAAGKGGA